MVFACFRMQHQWDDTDHERYGGVLTMDIEQNWIRIKTHRDRLSNEDVRGIATILFRGQEEWMENQLRLRKDESLVFEFLTYLGQAGSEKAADLLLKQLENREDVMQVAAVEGLKLCPVELILEALIRMVSKQNRSAIKAGEVIVSFGQPGVDALWQLWFQNDCELEQKVLILRLLGEAASKRAESLAYLAFLSDSEELQKEALVVCERLESRNLWGNVAACLGKTSWKLRGRAAKLLGIWGIQESFVYLQEMGVDPDPWVEEERQKAVQTLRMGAGV